MNKWTKLLIPLVLALVLAFGAGPSGAALFTQCPGDLNGDGLPDPFLFNPKGNPTGRPNPDYDPNVNCMHITGGDGFAQMADGEPMYMFSFGDASGFTPIEEVVAAKALQATTPAPIITVEQDQILYLTLTNVGMVMRPDLFDTHSVHWHGFPHAGPVFDGVPETSPTPTMAASLTYYYEAAVAGTYFYHCHVEAAEHMQMGMIGNTWIYPRQDRLGYGGDPNTVAGRVGGPGPYGYVYNDGDGSTAYDVQYPLQLTAFDSEFHNASLGVAALPFATMFDNYPMINGRGYPDTTSSADIVNQEGFIAQPAQQIIMRGDGTTDTIINSGGIAATSGDKILLRASNVSTTHLYTIATTLGVPMKVVGRDAAMLRGDGGEDTSMTVNVLNIAGGQAFDVIIDTTGVEAGDYFLYTTNLANLSNGPEDRGGIMTEINIDAAPAP